MAGPLVSVDTIIAGINYDVNRLLRAGVNNLEFIVPNRSEPSGWEILLTLTRGWDRVTPREDTAGDGSDVIVKVADQGDGDLAGTLETRNLHVRFNNEIFFVASVPPVAFNEAQVYELQCKTRTKRTTFDTAKGQ